MKTIRNLVYGAFLVIAFTSVQQPVRADAFCNLIGCSAGRYILECAGWEWCDGDHGYSEAFYESECASYGANPYFSGWYCSGDYLHFYCSFDGPPC